MNLHTIAGTTSPRGGAGPGQAARLVLGRIERMGSFRRDRWGTALVLVVAGLIIAVTSWLDGSYVSGAVILTLFAVFGWWSWPARRGPHVTHREAQDAAADDDLIVYWRPG